LSSAQQNYRRVTACRICESTNLRRFLDLGEIPLVNRYVDPTDREEEETYPLELLYCLECSLSQLSIVVDPGILYQNYLYRSSISRTFTAHCYDIAQHAVDRFKLKQTDLVLDIASNDGCALREFGKFGLRIMGIDPAENLAQIATDLGTPTIPAFWNVESATRILENHGEASFINAMNVFAHVDNLDQFLIAVNVLLKETGVFVIEVPYLLSFVNQTEFDTTYHEHLSYFLVKPLIKQLEKHNLTVFDIKQHTIHGGSIRVYVRKAANKSIPVDSQAVQSLLQLEKEVGLHDLATYLNFSKHVMKVKTDVLDLLQKLNSQGKVVAAYGASAKGSVLSNYCGINNNLVRYVIDDTPEKQGHLTPGNNIEIVPANYLQTQRPDYLLIFAWNFAKEIMEKTQEFRNTGGRYIIPIPNVRVI